MIIDPAKIVDKSYNEVITLLCDDYPDYDDPIVYMKIMREKILKAFKDEEQEFIDMNIRK